jgi:Family of unknown function (DUF6494)
MDEETLNMSVRKFLKTVGVTSQREIEKAIRAAVDDGRLPSGAPLTARARITVDGVNLDFVVDGSLDVG